MRKRWVNGLFEMFIYSYRWHLVFNYMQMWLYMYCCSQTHPFSPLIFEGEMNGLGVRLMAAYVRYTNTSSVALVHSVEVLYECIHVNGSWYQQYSKQWRRDPVDWGQRGSSGLRAERVQWTEGREGPVMHYQISTFWNQTKRTMHYAMVHLPLHRHSAYV